jgi:hypothetical protein
MMVTPDNARRLPRRWELRDAGIIDYLVFRGGKRNGAPPRFQLTRGLG